MKFRPLFLPASLLALTAAVTLAACSDDDNGSPTTAELRLVHADASAGSVDVQIAGTTVIHDLAYGHASAVTRVPGGMQQVVVLAGTTTVAELDTDLSRTALNSLLLSGSGVQVAGVTPDTGSVATARANIRMVNVVGLNTGDPSVLDVKVTAPAPDTVMTFGLDSRVASYGPIMYFDPGTFTFKFQPQGELTVLTEVTFEVAAGQTKDVVLERAANGSYSATVVVEE